MKYFVIGCNSMVGHVVSLYLKEHNHEVIGYDDKPSDLISSICGSLYDLTKLRQMIDNGQFHAVVNCSAVINQLAEEKKSHATFVNAFLPHFFEEITSSSTTIIIHRSTDCVFSGQRGRYDISDPPDGMSFYAQSKTLGEINNEKDITIRTSLVGPERERDGCGLFNWFANQTGEVRGFANSIWTGITTIEFAREIEYFVNQGAHGLFQCVPDKVISKYDLLKYFSTHLVGDRNVIRVENDYVDKSLLQNLGPYDLSIPDYEALFDDMFAWINAHKTLYEHYYK